MKTGRFVLIVGPSGAGKDTLIDLARHALAGDPRFIFSKRIVTREKTEWEDHDTLDPQTFAIHEAAGHFALSWHVHGLSYAIPVSMISAAEQGKIIVCNVSRTILAEAEAKLPNISVVEITASPELLAQRLKERARTADGSTQSRLKRSQLDYDRHADIVITNDTIPAAAAAVLIEYLKKLRIAQP